jgi:hypothetical protein
MDTDHLCKGHHMGLEKKFTKKKEEGTENYQKAHHPEKHWHRFSNEVACKINFSTCRGTVRGTSGLKSRPRIRGCHYEPHTRFR